RKRLDRQCRVARPIELRVSSDAGGASDQEPHRGPARAERRRERLAAPEMTQPDAGTGLGEERRAQGRAHVELRSVTDELLHLLRRQPPGVRIARVAEAGAGPLATLSAPEGPRGVDRLEQEHILELNGLPILLLGD